MVVIRLARSGSKKNPFYSIVVADKRHPRDGRFIEQIGFFNPVARGQATRLKLAKERAEHWIALGAQPSDRVSKLIKEHDQAAAGLEVKVTATKAQQRQAQAQEAAAKKPKVEKTEEIVEEEAAATPEETKEASKEA